MNDLRSAIQQHELWISSGGGQGVQFGSGATPASSFDLRGATFLSRKVLRGSNLDSVDMTASTLVGTWFVESSFRMGVARDAAATNTSWSGTDLAMADFSGADLTESAFTRCDCSGVIFDAATLTQARFWLTSLKGASFAAASVQGVALGNADMSQVNLDGSRWDGTFGTVAEPSESHPSWGGLDLVSALQARGASDVRYWGWEQRR